jgi:hypothetical protein
MKNFLVEAYTPAGASISEIEERTRLATAEAAGMGQTVRYLRSIFVPEDEICFHLFEADSSEAVRAASERARLMPARIVETMPLEERIHVKAK